MRRIALFAAALGLNLAFFASTAHADPVTYYVILHETLGNTGDGAGSFTIPYPSTNYKDYYSPTLGNLTSMSYSIGGDFFDLGNAIGSPFVAFVNQNLGGFGYSGGTLDRSVDLTLGPITYEFTDSAKGLTSQGYLTASTTPPPSPVPEPTTILLCITGAGMVATALRKRKLRS